MEKEPGRWKRPGVLLAIFVLLVVAVYFLVIFVKQSVNLYDLTRRVRAQEARVTQVAQENEVLRRQLESYQYPLLQAKGMGFKEPGERAAIPMEESGGKETGQPETEEPQTPLEELAALPTWQKWLWIIFVGPEH